MASSFVAGFTKLAAGVEPKVIVIFGNEPELRRRAVTAALNGENYEVYTKQEFTATELFFASNRSSKTKLAFLSNVSALNDWTWLDRWLKVTKNIRLIIETSDPKLIDFLENKVKSRGLFIDCSVPASISARQKLAKTVATWYDFTMTQVNILLNRNNWRVSECIQLLDKLTLLNLPLNLDTADALGLHQTPYREFVEAAKADNKSRALLSAQLLSEQEQRAALQELNVWLGWLSRLKVSQTWYKSVYEIAAEIGAPKSEIEELQKHARKWTLDKVNRMALALASADLHLASANAGALEMMVYQL